ncbi:MAG TPA: hypothetical protein VG756_17940 [Pseudonocardiaceae bacterium]|jgi:predicted lipoprotein with Yx(FWY)xxD motif|nr:hypothetical protein [Pseudonocardiaceae bacterium]
MNRVRAIGLAGVLGAGAVALAACTGTGTTSGSAGAATSSSTAAGSSVAPVTASAAGSALTAGTNATIGSIVLDGQNRTVYRFDKDTANPAVSNCSGSCAAQWPPVLAPAGSPRLSGVNAGKVGTVTRADGARQLTINGWPIYEFAGDSGSGDINGEGVGGTWFAITPAGGKALPGAATGAQPTTSSGGGYSSGGSYGGY